ncbi:MAG TPA: DUF4185 domain-containing protein [Candidatus Xenobia bacterium]|jgi:hypothetical protein
MRWWLALMLVGVAVAQAPELFVEAWPAADALFHQDARWRGADDAYSVDLGGDRTLWLFGDTFVDLAGVSRAHGVMVHNTVGLQVGRNPATARMQFCWRSGPDAFFPSAGETYYWPGDGVRVGHSLLVFLMAVHAVPGGMGFEVTGWRAVRVGDVSGDPSSWTVEPVASPQNPWHVVVGSASVLVRGDWVYAYGTHEPGVHDVYLCRWPVERLAAGDLQGAEWWTGAGWSREGTPAPVLHDGQTELTVHWDRHLGHFLEVQTVGFGDASVAVRASRALVGPWSEPQPVFEPSVGAEVFVYAGKAHPELSGAPLVLTYANNVMSLDRVVHDESLYYPHFLRGWWR